VAIIAFRGIDIGNKKSRIAFIRRGGCLIGALSLGALVLAAYVPAVEREDVMRLLVFRRSVLFIATVLALFVLVAVSCGGGSKEETTGGGGGTATAGPGDTTGVTDTSVKLGTLMPLTGAMAPWGIPISKGMAAYLDWINQQGGLYGRKLTLDVGDSGYTGPQGTEAARKLVEQDKVFAMYSNLGTEVEAAVAQYLTENNVPDLYVLTGSSLFVVPPVHNRYSSMVNYTTEGKIFAQYLNDNYAGKKLGILAQNDDFGKEGEAGTKAGLEDLSADIETTTEYYDAANTDVTAQAQRLKGDNVDVIMFWGGVPQAANLIKTARTTLTWDVPIVICEADAAEITATLAGFENIPGVVSTTVGIQAWQTDYPAVQQIKENMASVAPDLAFDNYSMIGWVLSQSVVGLLKQAGPDLTREGLLAAAESVCDYMVPTGLIPSSTSPEDHQFTEAEIFVKATVDNSVNPPVFRWVPFGDIVGYETTQDCTIPTPPANAENQPGPPLGTESYATPSPGIRPLPTAAH
jgi:branched-chain amino acid transport system substrate-binding protein